LNSFTLEIEASPFEQLNYSSHQFVLQYLLEILNLAVF